MTGTQVFDRLAMTREPSAEPDPSFDAMSRLAEQMVAAALTAGRMLRELRARMFPDEGDANGIAVARALRIEFEQWTNEAEELFRRVRALETNGPLGPIRGTEELRELIGLTKAMLQIKLDDHLRSLKEIASARVTSIEELRRELQLARRA